MCEVKTKKNSSRL